MKNVRKAFTLIELLVVVAIIALLIAILLPSLGRARNKAKATQCLASIRSLGLALQLYTTEYKSGFPAGNTPESSWMQLMQLGGYGSNLKARTCPEARDIRDPGSTALQVGSAHLQWANAILGGAGFNGSYGLNGFVYNYGGSASGTLGLFAGSSNMNTAYYFRLPKDSDPRVPTFSDSSWRHMFPQPTDPAPTNLENPASTDPNSIVGGASPNPMARLVINRHGRAVNVVFLDAHAETVKLPTLWTLRWNAKWNRSNIEPVK